jgi:hypothetical protein
VSIHIPNFEVCNAVDLASATATSTGLQLAISATGNTKSAWTQLNAATSADIDWLVIAFDLPAQSSIANAISLDIGIGAAGSEKVIFQDLTFYWHNTVGGGRIAVPLFIHKGSRVAVRWQSSSTNTSDIAAINIQGYTANFRGAAAFESIGFVSASTAGTALTSGAINTKGAYAQLVAATPRNYRGITWSVDGVGQFPSKPFLIDIAIGASGSEKIIMPNVAVRLDNGSPAELGAYIPRLIPAGTRIAARCQSTGASAVMNLTMYGAV